MQLQTSVPFLLILSLLFLLAAAEQPLRSPVEFAAIHHGTHLAHNIHKRADPLPHHAALRAREPQASPSPTPSAPLPSATADAPSLDATKAECQAALGALHGQPESPTGMSVCFRLAFLDTNSGAFETDLFLYQVAPASGNWTAVDPTSLHLGLSYPRAAIASEDTLGRRAPADGAPAAYAGGATKLAVRTAGPVLVTNMTLVGELDDEVLKNDAQDPTAMMAALSPQVLITAQRASGGGALRAVLPATEAAFVTGAYAEPARAAREAALAAAAAPPFVLPGTTLGIFPVSAVITGAWALLLVATVGWGTYGRVQFRRSFRRKRALPVGWGAGGVTWPGAAPAYDLR